MREIWLHKEGMMLLRTKPNFYTIIRNGKRPLYNVGDTGDWSVHYYPEHWKRIGFNYYLEKL